MLFPLLTSFLMVFHITIACFMGMKYWSSKRRLSFIFAFVYWPGLAFPG
ncbi:hypothetical protein CKQ90_16140 [Klebsiella pneumoniae]|nr:hypothetical protein CKQ90_16140 [Klebsiella pneumoniae]